MISDSQDTQSDVCRDQWTTSLDRSTKSDKISRASPRLFRPRDADGSDEDTQDKHLPTSIQANTSSLPTSQEHHIPSSSVRSTSLLPLRLSAPEEKRAVETRTTEEGSGEGATPKARREMSSPVGKEETKHLPDAGQDRAASSSPADTPLAPRRMLLVAKTLTNSDASSGRIILPRVAVEANLPFVTGYRHYSLSVRDTNGRRYEFVIKSWANGTEHRRVFVLEQVAEYMRTHRIGVGDTVGICADENGDLVVETNTDAVRQNAVLGSRSSAGAALSMPPRGAGPAGLPIGGCIPGKCARSIHCSKPAGHPGFCSGPKAAAAAAAATAHAHAAAAAAAARVRRRKAGVGHPSALYSEYVAAAAAASRKNGSSSQSYDHTQIGCDEYSGGEANSAATTVAIDNLPYVPMDSRLPAGLHPLAAISASFDTSITKTLTGYDLSSQRVILPAEEVEDAVLNASNLDVMTIAAVDESNGWQFVTLRAWHSVVGRRGYLLEGAGRFLTARGGIPGDVLVLRRGDVGSSLSSQSDSDGVASKGVGPPRIEIRPIDGDAPRQPAVADAETLFEDMPLLLLPKQPGQSLPYRSYQNASSTTSSDRAGLLCQRTSGCTKPAGHQGFCAGHKGFKRRDGSLSSTPTSAGGGRSIFRQHRLSVRSKKSNMPLHQNDDSLGSEDDEYTPSLKRQRQYMNISEDDTPTAGDPLLSLLSLLNN